MRVLMAVPKYPIPVIGGLERQAHELSKALRKRGHTIYVVSTCFDPSQERDELVEGVVVHRVPATGTVPLRFLQMALGLARIMYSMRQDIDLVHVHNISWFGAVITIFAKTLGLAVMTKLPNIGDFGIPGMRRRALGSLRVALLKACDAIVAMTPQSIQELQAIGYPLARVLKVTNGISVSADTVPRSRIVDVVCAVYVGRLSQEKGVVDLLHAWRDVKGRTIRAAALLLIGDGPQTGELHALTASLEIADSVHFLGYRTDVSECLTKADVFVLPSYAEGNSNAILEAMCAGLPILATRVGGAEIQVGSEGERFLVPPGDRRLLAERLGELIDNETLRVGLGAAMRERVQTAFGIDRVAATYELAYQLIIAGRHEQIGQINRSLFHLDGA